jgi:hypothetical protein
MKTSRNLVCAEAWCALRMRSGSHSYNVGKLHYESRFLSYLIIHPASTPRQDNGVHIFENMCFRNCSPLRAALRSDTIQFA